MVTVEYVVAGPLLALIGVAQIWLKRSNAIEVARRAGDAGGGATSVTTPTDDHDAGEGDMTAEVSSQPEAPVAAADSRKPPLWDAWTGILGYVAVALGIVVLVMGLLGK